MRWSFRLAAVLGIVTVVLTVLASSDVVGWAAPFAVGLAALLALAVGWVCALRRRWDRRR